MNNPGTPLASDTSGSRLSVLVVEVKRGCPARVNLEVCARRTGIIHQAESRGAVWADGRKNANAFAVVLQSETDPADIIVELKMCTAVTTCIVQCEPGRPIRHSLDLHATPFCAVVQLQERSVAAQAESPRVLPSALRRTNFSASTPFGICPPSWISTRPPQGGPITPAAPNTAHRLRLRLGETALRHRKPAMRRHKLLAISDSASGDGGVPRITCRDDGKQHNGRTGGEIDPGSLARLL
jgi:hypothetical protein